VSKIKSHIRPNSSSIEEFLSGKTTFSDKYSHLQVFLHRKREKRTNQDYEFLMVTPSCFGKVIVQDLSFEDPYIIVEFFNCALQKTGIVRIDIHDAHPKALFICWQDVKRMVQADRNYILDNSELLEFDF
jgi:hypothetical protein